MHNSDVKVASLGRSMFFSAIITASLILIPILVKTSTEFLGQDVSSLALGILGFYPWVAVKQMLLLAMLALLIVTFLVSVITANFRKITPLRLVASVYLWFGVLYLSGLFKYPAFFLDFHSPRFGKIIWQVAPYVRSDVFVTVAFVAPAFLVTRLLVIWLKGGMLSVHKGRVGVAFFVVALTAMFGLLRLFKTYSANAESSDAKNRVLFIGIDSLRSDAINDRIAPNIAALLADSQTVNFEDHFVGIPRTFPSWLEILTGKYASQTGLRHMFPSLALREGEFQGLGSILRDSGYKTFIVSDFAGDIFPRFKAGFEAVDAPSLTITGIIKMNVDLAFTAFLPIYLSAPMARLFPELKQVPTLADPEDLQRKLLRSIEARQFDSWFGLVFFSTAHFPYAAPEPFYRQFADPKYQGEFLYKKNPEAKVTGQEIAKQDASQVKALYNGSIAAIDVELGKVFDHLKRQGIWKSTTIVITADHGEEIYDDSKLQGHGEHLKSEVVIKVPLLIKLPNDVKPVIRNVSTVSAAVDIMPTLLGFKNIKTPTESAGFDFSRYILGRVDTAPRTYAYSETGIWFSRSGEAHFQKNRLDYPGINGLLEFDQGKSDEIVLNRVYEDLITIAKHRAIITSNYKLIYMPTRDGVKLELFDRIKDPENRVNLAKDKPEAVANLSRILEDHTERYELEFERKSEFFIRKRAI